jgi:hypothetical protein
MPRVIQIRDVPDDVHDALTDAAVAQGLSLTRYMLRDHEPAIVGDEPPAALQTACCPADRLRSAPRAAVRLRALDRHVGTRASGVLGRFSTIWSQA